MADEINHRAMMVPFLWESHDAWRARLLDMVRELESHGRRDAADVVLQRLRKPMRLARRR